MSCPGVLQRKVKSFLQKKISFLSERISNLSSLLYAISFLLSDLVHHTVDHFSMCVKALMDAGEEYGTPVKEKLFFFSEQVRLFNRHKQGLRHYSSSLFS